MNRRALLGAIATAGAGGGAAVGVVVWRSDDGPTVESEDDDTHLHPGPVDDHGDDNETGTHRIEVDHLKKHFERFNSDSVSFVHGAFTVCNAGKTDACVWIDADPLTNDRDEPSVRFYRGRDLQARIDDADSAVCLEPDECLKVGVMTRTFGIREGTVLLERILVRTDRPS